MLPSLSRYAYLNARIKALYSFLLPEKELRALSAAATREDLINILKTSPYHRLFNDPEVISQPRRLEKELYLYDIRLHRKIESWSRGVVREMVFALLGRYDLQNFKALLRLWFQPQIREGEVDYLIREKICYPLEIEPVLASRSLEELIGKLSSTPYPASLSRAAAEFREAKTLFPLEAALDQDYYHRLRQAVERLPSSDRRVASRLIGVGIDIENIQWLIRGRRYYQLPPGELLRYLIPNGYRLHTDLFRGMFLREEKEDTFSRLGIRAYESLRPLLSSRLEPEEFSLLEEGLRDIMMREARVSFRRFPFTIATVISFLIFKRAETEKLVNLIYRGERPQYAETG